MSTYGTIPANSPEKCQSERIARARERLQMGLGTRRRWQEVLAVRSFGAPASFAAALRRAATNLTYFRMNYAIFVLLVLFLSLLWRPASLIVFVAAMAAWLFLYFLRDEALLLFGRVVDDRVVLIALGILTVVFLLLTHGATVNVVAAVLGSAAVVVVHAVFRRTDDLFLDENAAEYEGLLNGAAAVVATGGVAAADAEPSHSPPSP